MLAGRVTVNGVVVRTLGVRADPAADAIAVDGERITVPATRRTILLHKPRGVVSTAQDPEGRPTVRDLIGGARLYPVGRLDVNSTGLLLLTNDGTLAAGLLHPRREVPRVYHAKVRGTPSEEAITRLRRGVRLDDGKTAPARVRVLGKRPTKTWLEITVTEGRTRLVRRMCEAVGHPVDKLARVRFGPLALGALPIGASRDLGARDIAALEIAAGIRRGGAEDAGRRRRGRGTPPRRRRRKSGSRRPGEARTEAPPARGATGGARRRGPRRPRP